MITGNTDNFEYKKHSKPHNIVNHTNICVIKLKL